MCGLLFGDRQMLVNLIRYTLLNYRIRNCLERVMPLELFVICVIVCFANYFIIVKKKDFVLSKQRMSQVIVGFSFLTLFAFIFNLARLLVSTADVPTVFEALRFSKKRPECASLLGTGTKNFESLNIEELEADETRIKGARKIEQKNCLSLLSVPSLYDIGIKDRLFAGLKRLKKLFRKGDWVSSDKTEVFVGSLHAYNKSQVIRIDSPDGIDSYTPVSCFPRPMPAKATGVLYLPGRKPTYSDLAFYGTDVGLKRLVLIPETQYSCFGASVKVKGQTTTFLFSGGTIRVLNPVDEAG